MGGEATAGVIACTAVLLQQHGVQLEKEDVAIEPDANVRLVRRRSSCHSSCWRGGGGGAAPPSSSAGNRRPLHSLPASQVENASRKLRQTSVQLSRSQFAHFRRLCVQRTARALIQKDGADIFVVSCGFEHHNRAAARDSEAPANLTTNQ